MKGDTFLTWLYAFIVLLAGIAEDIRAMPMGMNTLISEEQGGISGGQRQRIMIARAIAPKPKLLIFDEATPALDNKTQKQASEALDSMGCTRLVIAHRLSTIRHCDRILVLDGGRIIEDGNYDELLEKGWLLRRTGGAAETGWHGARLTASPTVEHWGMLEYALPRHYSNHQN